MIGAMIRMSFTVAVSAAPAAAQMHAGGAAPDTTRAASPLHATTLAPAPAVEELVREALERAPEIAAASARVEAARASTQPAGAMPNPMLEVSYLNGDALTQFGTEEPMSMFGFELTQPLPFPGKRAARQRAAGFETSVRMHEQVAAERATAREVRAAYASLYRLDRTAAELDVARELVDLLAATAASRYGTGESEMEAQLKAQLEATRLAGRLDDLHAERAAALARLNRVLGRPQSQEIGRVASLPNVAPPAGSWEDGALRFAPEVAARNAAVAMAESQLDVARQEGRPDFYAVLGIMARREGDPFWTVRLGTELPLWSRPGRLEPAATADLAAVLAESRSAQRDARAEAARLTSEWRRADAQVSRTRDAILPQTSTAFDAARTAYVAGSVEFATVIADFRAWLDARIELAEREAERFTTWAELEALVAPPDTHAPGGSQ